VFADDHAIIRSRYVVPVAIPGTRVECEVRGRVKVVGLSDAPQPWPIGEPWEAWEDELLRTLPPAEVAKRTGRTLSAALSRRHVLGLPDGRRREERRKFDRS
jgi:hypothetical protein